MSVPGQNIIELGWDLEKFDAQKKVVAQGLTEQYELIQKIGATPITLGSTGGWGELKNQATALREAMDKLQDSQKSQVAASKAAQQEALNEARIGKEAAAQKLLEAKAAAENAKQLLNEAKAASELERAKTAANKATASVKPASQSREDYVNSIPFENRTQVNTASINDDRDAINELERAHLAESQAATQWANSQVNAAAATGEAAQADRNAIVESEALIKAKEALAFAQSEENVELQGYKLQAAAATAAAKEQAAAGLGLEKTIEKEITDYEILSKAYEDAAARYKQLAILQRGLPIGEKGATLAAAAEVKALDEELKKLDSDVGRANKSVGLYNEGVKQVQVVNGTASKASTGFANSLGKQRLLFMDVGRLATEQSFGLRAIASNFALFGPAVTIAAAAVGGLIYLVTKHTEAQKMAAAAVEKHRKEIQELIVNYRDLSQINADAAGSTIGESTHVQALSSIVQDQTKSYKERNDALLQLKDINKAYFGDLTLEQASLKTLTDRVTEYTNALISQAIIKELEGDIGKVGAAYFRQANEINKANDKLREHEALLYSNSRKRDPGSQEDYIEKGAKLRGEVEKQVKAFEPLRKQYDELKQEIIDATNAAEKFKPLKDPKGADHDGKLKTIREKEFEEEAKDYIAQNKKMSTLEDVGFEGRLQFLQNAYAKEDELLQKNKNNELIVEKNKLDDVLNFKKSSKNQRINAENEYNAAVDYIRKKFAYDELKIDQDFENNSLSIKLSSKARLLQQDKETNQLFVDEDTKAYEDRLKKIDERNKKLQNGFAETRDIELASLEKKYNKKGKFDPVSEKKFNEDKLKIEHDFLRASLNQNIEYTEALIQLEKKRGVDTSKAEADLQSYKKQLADNDLKYHEDIAKKKRASEQQYFDAVKNLTEQLVTLTATLATAGFEKQKNAIQELINANNDWASAETDRINNSSLSEQEKSEKLIQIKATEEAKNKQLQQEQKQADIKKARYEKAASIFQILLNTAAAVSKALYEGGPLYAVLVGALGAAQLATAIATPIPTYAHGTPIGGHPGGDAVVGEGRFKELVEPKGGQPYIADRPMYIRGMAPGSHVTPLTDAVINEAMQGSSVANMSERMALVEAAEAKRQNDAAWKIAKWQADQNREAIEQNNKKTIKIINKIDSFWNSSYVSKNIFGK